MPSSEAPKDREGLAEKVARAIAEHHFVTQAAEARLPLNPSLKAASEYADEYWNGWVGEARAALRVALEAAAEVADDSYWRELTAADAAQKIRSLSPMEGEESTNG